MATARTTIPSPQTACPEDILERIGTALADQNRRRIILRLLDGPGYPAEFAELLETSRANISNHLACLRGCGIVTAYRESRNIRYQLASPKLTRALTTLVSLQLTIEHHHLDLDGRS